MAYIAAQHCLTRLVVVKAKVETQPGDMAPALLAESIKDPTRELLESWRALYVTLSPNVERDFLAACDEPVAIGEVVLAESAHSAALWVSHLALASLSIVLMPSGCWPISEDPKTDCFLVDLRSETHVEESEKAVRGLRTVFDQLSLKDLRKCVVLPPPAKFIPRLRLWSM